MGHYNFSKDLKASQASVDKVREYLENVHCYDVSTNNDFKYDLYYTTEGGTDRTAEVKEDLMFSKTGNVAIEFQSRGKASGITTSKADRWFYVLGDEIFMANTPDILVYLIQHWDRFKRVPGGDDKTSLVALLPLNQFKELFKKVK